MNTGHDKTTQSRVAMERIVRMLMDEIAVAYVQGDAPLLCALGVTAEQAQAVETVIEK